MPRKTKRTKEFVQKFKTICPKCKQEVFIILKNYKENKNKDGVIFTYQCLTCQKKYDTEKKYTDFKKKE